MTPLDPAGRDECLYCEQSVSDRFCAVFGDSDDRAHRCPNCDTWRRIHDGTAAGIETETPDPQVSAGRHGGEPA